jgi:hypothetical protein
MVIGRVKGLGRGGVKPLFESKELNGEDDAGKRAVRWENEELHRERRGGDTEGRKRKKRGNLSDSGKAAPSANTRNSGYVLNDCALSPFRCS